MEDLTAAPFVRWRPDMRAFYPLAVAQIRNAKHEIRNNFK